MKRLDQQYDKVIIDPKKVIKVEPGVNTQDLKHPDPEKHQLVSFLKSAIRLLGYLALPFNLTAAVIILVVSEVVGIIEELV